jgi:hypothetical protein
MESVVDIQLGTEHIKFESAEFMASLERVRSLRPQAIGWISSTLRTEVIDHIFDVNPIRNLAYGWLREDLAKIFWVD